MAQASKSGNYAGGQEAIGPDVEATLDSIIERVNAITLEQMGNNTVGTSQLIDLNVTLAKIAAGAFTADAAGRAKFADGFVNRAKQANEAKGAGSYVKYVHSTAGHGGSSSVSTWNARVLNSLETDAESIGAGTPDGSGIFVLPAGTYYAHIVDRVHGVSNHQARLRNRTDTVTALLGVVGLNTQSDVSIITGYFTVGASKNLQVQHWTQGAVGTIGLGNDANTGENNIYSIAEFWKVA